MPQRLLVVEDRPSILDDCLAELSDDAPEFGYDFVQWRECFAKRLPERNPAMILIVAHQGLLLLDSFFQWAADSPFTRPILAVISTDNDPDLTSKVSCVCDDFVIAPPRNHELLHRIRRLLGWESADQSAVERRLREELARAGLIGHDPRFLQAVGKIPHAARTSGPVLITGETGTGKEMCARAIHNLSARVNKPFVPIDCASLPDHLFENEVFGHVSGAYTDARRDQKGLLALAEGGTLFLDEIDSLSFGAQAKLLRFLEERRYRPLGGDRFVSLDVNVIAASNRDLEELVQKKAFRSDLFFRLDVFRLNLPPLRERRGDIAPLVRQFVSDLCLEHGIRKTITPAALRKLAHLDWPGNVRQLYNIIKRAMILCEGSELLPSHIESSIQKPGSQSELPTASFREARKLAIASFERTYVEQLMEECRGNISRAARMAQKDRRTFGRLVKRYGIARE